VCTGKIKKVLKNILSGKEHEDQCLANHSMSSDKMEVDAIKTMFSSSEEKFQVKYTYTNYNLRRRRRFKNI